MAAESVDVGTISPLAWRLLRVAAGYEQRSVERQLDDLLQAHLSMLENGTRGLSRDRREELLAFYTTDLTAEQVRVLVEAF